MNSQSLFSVAYLKHLGMGPSMKKISLVEKVRSGSKTVSIVRAPSHMNMTSKSEKLSAKVKVYINMYTRKYMKGALLAARTTAKALANGLMAAPISVNGQITSNMEQEK